MSIRRTRRDFLRAVVSAPACAGFRLGTLQRPQRVEKKLHNNKGIRINTLPKGLGTADALKLAVNSGFNQLEPFATFDEHQALAIKTAAKAAGIRIGSVANAMNWKYPLSSSDPPVAKKGLEAQTAALQNAHLWGADAILMIPAVVTPTVSYRDAWARSRRQIEQLLPL